MTITLSSETQLLLEQRMKLNGISNADDAVRELLLETERPDRSPETMAAICAQNGGQCGGQNYSMG